MRGHTAREPIFFPFSFSPTHIHTFSYLCLQAIFWKYSFSLQSARALKPKKKEDFRKIALAVLASIGSWMFLRVGEKEKGKKIA